MTEYYYTSNPEVGHDLNQIQFNLLGHEMTFTTDNGVFSKHAVDYGSRVLIQNVNIVDLPAGDILDLGCGYGPIGISLAKAFPDRQFLLSDVNHRAMKLAEQNAQQNQVSNIKVFESSVYDQIDQKFAAVITNPPVRAGKQIVDAMITGAAQHLVPTGRLTIVLQKKQGAPSAKKLMQATFGNTKILKRDKGYYIIESIKH